jgi:glycosyltransferase involved in cell wall biosynthesis
MTEQPLVSIGLPTYNRVARLERAVKFILAQDYPNIELVISDNASGDETPALCRRLAEADRRVRYFRQQSNVGPTANYAAALSAATGELYMATADDDWLAPNYVSSCMTALAADRSLVSVVGRPEMYQGEQAVRNGEETTILDDSPEERVVRFYRTVVENSGFHGLARREILLSLPGMPNVMGGDWLWMASIAFRGKIQTVPTTRVFKEEGGTSVKWAAIASTLKLPAWQGRYGWEAILLAACQDIAYRSPVYETLGRQRRLTLATRVAVTLARKWQIWTPWPFYVRRAVSERVRAALGLEKRS